MDKISTDHYPSREPERRKNSSARQREEYYRPRSIYADGDDAVRGRRQKPRQKSGGKKSSSKSIGKSLSAFWREMNGVLRNKQLAFDKPLVIIVMLLLAVGLIMVYSASYAYAYYNNGDSMYYIKRQIIFALIGVLAMTGISTIPPRRLKGKVSYLILGVSYFLLVLVLFLPRMQGVRRWINLGFTTFQPSEIAKFAAILTCATYISRHYKEMNVTSYPDVETKLKANRSGFAHWRYAMGRNFLTAVVPFVAMLGPMLALVVIEPHLSCTILLMLIIGTQMYLGGTRKEYFIGLGVLAAVAVYLVIFTDIVPYGSTRIQVWQDPFVDPLGDGWQNIQSLYAISSGGLFGVGLGNSRQKYLYISEPQNDFIFAVVCEELGLIGAMAIILLFAAFVWRGFTVSVSNPDRFSKLVGIGITSQIGFQMILNICVVTNMVPNTGISLPFFSSGGTSLTMLLAEIGVLLAISRSSPNKVI